MSRPECICIEHTQNTILTSELTHTEAVYIAAVTHSLCYTDYKLLSEWLGCYVYSYPADRMLSPRLVSSLLQYLTVINRREFSTLVPYQVWNYSCWAEHLTQESQERIAWKLLQLI